MERKGYLECACLTLPMTCSARQTEKSVEEKATVFELHFFCSIAV